MPAVTEKPNLLIAKLDGLVVRLAELDRSLIDPGVVTDRQALHRAAKERADIVEIVSQYTAYRALLDEIAQTDRLAADPQTDHGFRALALEEAHALDVRRTAMEEALRLALIPKDARDEKNIFMEIRAGTGGGRRRCLPPSSFACTGSTRNGGNGGSNWSPPARPGSAG